MPRPDPIRALRRRNRHHGIPKGAPALKSPDRPLRALECRELPLTPELRAAQADGLIEPGARLFELGECKVMVCCHPKTGYHLSISHPRRIPLYNEWTEARYRLVPDEATMAMVLPPRDQFVNIHQFCLHLWQIPWEGR